MFSHQGKFKFWCDDCKKGFQNKNNYECHMAKHEGKTFPCQYCTKRFAYEYRLKNHMSEHTHLFKFCCPICGLGLNSKSSLAEHEKKRVSTVDKVSIFLSERDGSWEILVQSHCSYIFPTSRESSFSLSDAFSTLQIFGLECAHLHGKSDSTNGEKVKGPKKSKARLLIEEYSSKMNYCALMWSKVYVKKWFHEPHAFPPGAIQVLMRRLQERVSK